MNQIASSSNGLLSVFAKKEKTIDPIDIGHGMGHRLDTVIYHDPECTKLFARWPWHYSGLPRRSSKKVTLNCWTWNLVWCN